MPAAVTPKAVTQGEWEIVMGKLKKEYMGRAVVTVFGLFIILLTVSIGAFLLYQGLGTFTKYNHTVGEFLFSSQWKPSMDLKGGGQVGAAIFIAGSMAVSFLALVIAMPFSLAASIFMSEISPRLGKRLLQPAIEIFVGIPSVVYGWVGMTVLAPLVAKVFHLPFGYGLLSASIVLALMIFPTITTLSADAIRNVNIAYKEASLGLGSTRWQMICRAVLPSALPGIITGIILGLTRAFGEALAVSMVIGKMQTFPKTILSSTDTLTAEIAADMGNAAQGGEFSDALWTMALLLFLISFVLILLVRIISRKGEKNR